MSAPYYYNVRFGLHTNPKIMAVAQDLNIHRGIVVSVWIALMELAKKCDADGMITDFDMRTFSVMVDVSVKELLTLLKEFQDRKMVEISFDGEKIESVSLLNWSKYQTGQSKRYDENGNLIPDKYARYRARKKREREELRKEVGALKKQLEKLTRGVGKDKDSRNTERVSAEKPDASVRSGSDASDAVRDDSGKNSGNGRGAAEKIYDRYQTLHKGGFREKALKNIREILKKVPESALLASVENYRMDREYNKRLEPRFIKEPVNFFKPYDGAYKEYLPERFDKSKYPGVSVQVHNPADLHPRTGEPIKPTEWLSLMDDEERLFFEKETFGKFLETQRKRELTYESLDAKFERKEFEFPEKHKRRDRLKYLKLGIAYA